MKEPIKDLFSMPAQPELFCDTEFNPEPEEDVIDSVCKIVVGENQTKIEAPPEQVAEIEVAPSSSVDFYQLFTSELQRLAEKPVTVDELVEITQLHKSQLIQWLKRAVDDEIVKKLNRPVRYQTKNMK